MKSIKPIKVALASMLVGVSAFSFAACSACDGLPTWLGGKAPTYTVVIHINGKETNMEVTEDAIPEKPADPVREGYTFRGWYLDAAGETPYNFDTPLNADCTLYAVFDEKEYVVTYVVDGVSDAVTYKWSETPTYATPKKDGYVFKTWCLDEELTQHYVFIAPVQDSLTVYAKFAEAYKVQYVVTPNVNEEESGGVNTEIVETENETPPVKPQDPKVEGYDFEGWYLDKDFTEEYNFDTVLAEGSTIYAKLVEKQYVVTYTVGGTEDILSTVTYNYWDIPTQPETPTHNGEYFFGWYLDEAYENSYDFSYTFKQDTTVYAQFLESKPIYTADELQAIKDYPAGNYVLMNDIDLIDGWTPIETFSGKFNGNGYRLFNFAISTTGSLSGFIKTNDGTIKDLILDEYLFSQNYTDTYTAGGFIAVNNGIIENFKIINSNISFECNCSADKSVYVGGLVGKNYGLIKNSLIENSQLNFVAIDGYYEYNQFFYAGGAVGLNYGEISKVSVKSTIKGSAESVGEWGRAQLSVGGIVCDNEGELNGCVYSGEITVDSYRGGNNHPYLHIAGVTVYNRNVGKIYNSYTEGIITETITKTGAGSICLYAGGFISDNYGIVQNCYAEMIINTTSVADAYYSGIGGFVASNRNTITNCYATGSISTDIKGDVGGFVANNDDGILKNSFSSVDITISTTNLRALGVFVGNQGTSSNILKCYYDSERTVKQNETDYISEDVYGVTGATVEELYSKAILIDKLYWNETVWVIDGESAPTLSWQQPAAI